MSPSSQVRIEAHQFFSSSFHGVGENKIVSFLERNKFSKKLKRRVESKKKSMQEEGLVEEGEEIFGILEESGFEPSIEKVL